MRYVLFDLDGCLSDDRHRAHWREERNWREYHASQCQDPPINKEVVYLYRRDPHVQVTYITARPECYRADTVKWLRDHDFVNDADARGDRWRLLMRPSHDTITPPPDLKVNLLKVNGIQADDVIAAFDNQSTVLDAYIRYGIRGTSILDYSGRSWYVPKQDRPEVLADDEWIPDPESGDIQTEEKTRPAPDDDAPVPVNAYDVLCTMATTYRNRAAAIEAIIEEVYQ